MTIESERMGVTGMDEFRFDETEDQLIGNPIREIVYEIGKLERALNKLQTKLHDQKIKTRLQRDYKKNKDFIYNRKLIRKFYHYRDSQNAPRITVCIIFDPKTNMFHRGVSICSVFDCVSKEEGRDLAENRAILAMKLKEDGEKFIGKEAILHVGPDLRKSYYNVTEFTIAEKKLFKINDNSNYNLLESEKSSKSDTKEEKIDEVYYR